MLLLCVILSLEPFQEAVGWKELGLFDYPEIIKKSMDLEQVKAKIERDEYQTAHHIVNDVRLVWIYYIH